MELELLEWMERIFSQYGYLVLLIGLPIDFIALPIPPGQTTLTYTGYLSSRGVLYWLPAMLAAFTGSAAGITVTYWIGYKFGQPLLNQFAHRKFIKKSFMLKVRRWHERYGCKVLLFSFFIPGFRQVYGYYMGMIRVPYRKFALYGYAGTAIWVSVFFMIGYGFADQWQVVFVMAEKYFSVIFVSMIGLLTGVIIYKGRNRIRQLFGTRRAKEKT